MTKTGEELVVVALVGVAFVEVVAAAEEEEAVDTLTMEEDKNN